MADINKLTVVQISQGISGKPTVVKWNPGSYEQPTLSETWKVLGVSATDAAQGEDVACIKQGYLRECPFQNSETWAVGDILYAKSDGSVSKTRQAGPMTQLIVGTVFAVSGSYADVDVNLQIIPSMGELSGVSQEAPADKDVFIYKSSTHVWEPRQIDHGADIAGLLDDDHTQYLKEKGSGGLASEIPTHTHQSAAEAGTLDHGLSMVASSLLDNDHPLYQRKHGFEVDSAGAALVTLSYDSSTRKVTVTPTGSTFTYYIDGVQVIKTGAQQTPTGHAASTGGHFLTYDAAGNFTWSTTAWSILDRTKTPVAFVYYYTGTSQGICFFECHSADRWLEGHANLHATQGTKKISGFALSGYTLNTDSDAGVTFAVASGVIADEDIQRSLTAVADGGPYTVFYRTAAGGDWTWDATPTFPFLNGATYPSWNNVDAGGVGVWGMTELVGTGGGNWVNYYLCAVPSITAGVQMILIPGQATHASLASAQGESLSSLSLTPTFPFQEIAPLYKITYHARSTYAGTHKAQLQQVTEITTGGASVLVGSSPSIHNTLSGRSATDTHPASSITFTPYSTIAATNVQDAIQELLDEGGGGGATTLNGLTDVNAPSPANGEVLTWDSTPGEWVPAVPPSAAAFASLSDVNVAGVADGDLIVYDNATAKWIKITKSALATALQSLIKLDDLATPDDNTDLNASTSRHGLLKKLSNVSTEFMNGQGNWATPAGGGGSGDGYYPTIRLDLRYPNGTGTTGSISTLVNTIGAETIVYNVTYSGDNDTIPALATTNLMTRSPRVLLTAGSDSSFYLGPRLKTSPFTSSPIFYVADKFIVRFTFAVNAFASNTQMGIGVFEDGYQWNGPSTSVSNKAGVVLHRDASDANWYMCHNDSSGGVTRVDTGIVVTAAKVCRLEIKSDGTNVLWKLEQEDSTTASGTLTTNIPAVLLLFGAWTRKNGGTTPSLALMDFMGIPFQSAVRDA